MPLPSRVRERLVYYLAGVAIGLMLLGMARLAWTLQHRQTQPSGARTP